MSKIDHDGVGAAWRIPDALWERIEPLLCLQRRRVRRAGGHGNLLDSVWMESSTCCGPAASGKRCLARSVLRALCMTDSSVGEPPESLRSYGKQGLSEYDQLHGIDWQWQAMDGAMTKAPLGG